jgi:hypothetical protein
MDASVIELVTVTGMPPRSPGARTPLPGLHGENGVELPYATTHWELWQRDPLGQTRQSGPHALSLSVVMHEPAQQVPPLHIIPSAASPVGSHTSVPALQLVTPLLHSAGVQLTPAVHAVHCPWVHT